MKIPETVIDMVDRLHVKSNSDGSVKSVCSVPVSYAQLSREVLERIGVLIDRQTFVRRVNNFIALGMHPEKCIRDLITIRIMIETGQLECNKYATFGIQYGEVISQDDRRFGSVKNLERKARLNLFGAGIISPKELFVQKKVSKKKKKARGSGDWGNLPDKLTPEKEARLKRIPSPTKLDSMYSSGVSLF